MSIADALKKWAVSHRFAGSSDRAQIAGILYDCERCKISAAWQMGKDDARSLILGMLKRIRKLPLTEIKLLYSGEKYAPAALSAEELRNYERDFPDHAASHIAGDYPIHLESSIIRAFGMDVLENMQAMIVRAPLDLRVNLLKNERDHVFSSLIFKEKTKTLHSPWGIRIPLNDTKPPKIQNDPAYLDGEIEIQDEGSQIISLLAGAYAGNTVIDLCAGGGGKTLALAAVMQNKGRLYAYDKYPKRLEPIRQRLSRAGATNVSVIFPDGSQNFFINMAERADLVVVDAPCSGSGTWRRSPEEKWTLTSDKIEKRVIDQITILGQAAELTRSGGYIAYMTCSFFCEENDDVIASFLKNRSDFSFMTPVSVLQQAKKPSLENYILLTKYGLMLTPLKTGTDGFFLSVIKKNI